MSAHEAVGAELGTGAHRDRVRILVASFVNNKHFEEYCSKFFSGQSEASKRFRGFLFILIVRLAGAIERTKAVEDKDAYDIIPPYWLN